MSTEQKINIENAFLRMPSTLDHLRQIVDREYFKLRDEGWEHYPAVDRLSEDWSADYTLAELFVLLYNDNKNVLYDCLELTLDNIEDILQNILSTVLFEYLDSDEVILRYDKYETQKREAEEKEGHRKATNVNVGCPQYIPSPFDVFIVHTTKKNNRLGLPEIDSNCIISGHSTFDEAFKMAEKIATNLARSEKGYVITYPESVRVFLGSPANHFNGNNIVFIEISVSPVAID